MTEFGGEDEFPQEQDLPAQWTGQGDLHPLTPMGQPPPPQPPPPPPPAPRKWYQLPSSGRGRWLGIAARVIGVLMTVAVLFVGAGVAYIWLTSAGVSDNVPTDAAIGECYDRTGSKQPVECDGPHHFEVFTGAFYPQAKEYPGVVGRSLGNQVCDEEFEIYTGESYWSSDLDYTEVFPSEEDWLESERFTICVLHHSELKVLDSRQGTWATP